MLLTLGLKNLESIYVDKLHGKIDRVLYAILGGLGATILTLIGLFY